MRQEGYQCRVGISLVLRPRCAGLGMRLMYAHYEDIMQHDCYVDYSATRKQHVQWDLLGKRISSRCHNPKHSQPNAVLKLRNAAAELMIQDPFSLPSVGERFETLMLTF